MSRDDDVFAEARVLPAPERTAFLNRACADDPTLRHRIEELLAGYAEAERALPAAFSARESTPPEEKPSDRIGRYKLLQKIGEGGCGAVWMAEQEEPVRRRVALKVIKLGMDTKEVIARFEAERQALALMDHPNIARVLDAGATANGRPFFVMELVRGIPITRYCDEGNLSTAARLELFAQVCHAIQHAHQKGIVHRDIKPSNILVAQHDHLAVPKVIDFGIAKATQGRLTDATLFTAFEQFIGTPAYMSPEQAELSGLDVDARSDVYSLGVLLYELLTGKPPFDPKSLQQAGLDEIRRIIREVEPPRPSTRLSTLALSDRTALAKLRGTAPAQLTTQLSGDLDWIVMHCLEKDRSRRYASPDALAQDLQRHLQHEPVVARPPSFSYRLGKFVRRRRVGVAVAAVVSLALALGATSLWQARRAERAEKVAAKFAVNTAPISPKSIAVLPFENLSEEKEANAFFVDGMHEDVIAGLTRIPDLRCVPRPTVAAYRDTKKPLRELAGELQVASVLTGSVRRSGQKVRLTATLVDARTTAPRWSRTYDRELADVFAIQAELAQAIAAELKAVISPEIRQELERRPTENLAAYDLYLKAREIANGGFQFFQSSQKESRATTYLQKQESLLHSAVTLDPKFAAAWAQLARVDSNAYYGFEYPYKDRSETRRANARAAIGKALSLAPEDPDVILGRGYFLQLCERDYAGAAEAFETVMRRLPNDPAPHFALGHLRRAQARWTEALDLLRRATVLDPASMLTSAELRVLLAAARRYDELGAERRRIAALQGKDGVVRPTDPRALFFANGDTRDMDAVAKADPRSLMRFAHHHEKFVPAFLEYFPNRPTQSWLQPLGPTASADWGLVLHYAVLLKATGQTDEAHRWLEHAPANLRARLALEPDNTSLLCDLGCIEALLGHPEEALRAVQRAMEIIPYELDAWQSPQVEENLAFVYAWTGDKTRAIETYAKLLRTPHVSPRQATPSVHTMRHALWYSPLRGDPRWEALLADPKNNAPLF